jgi:2-C-methyl-D-erythritol 4-phosphate cytidylyltransferase
MVITTPFQVVAGGATRSESVKNGLTALAENANPDDVVMIHDATHPYLDDDALPAVIEATRRHGGATLGAPQYDTVYRVDPATRMLTEVVPRETVFAGASPEAFLFGRLYEVYTTASMAELERRTSAGALALAHGIDMEVVPTSLINLKITYQHDMQVFKKLFYDYYF